MPQNVCRLIAVAVLLLCLSTGRITTTTSLFMGAHAAVTGSWATKTHLYTPRSKHTIMCENHTIYIHGGRSGFNTVLGNLFEFRTDTKTWKELFSTGTIPRRFGAAVFTFPAAGEMFLFGGNDQNGFITDDLWLRSNNRWSHVTQPAHHPVPRTRFAYWIPKATPNTFFLFAGMTELGPSNEVWSYNRVSSTWTLNHDGTGGPNLAPVNRYDPCCVYVESTEQTFCFAGTASNGDLDDLWRFDHTANTWAKVATGGASPPPRRLAVCEITNGYFFIWSGFDSTAANYVSDTDVHRISLTSFVWERIPQSTALLTRDSHKMCQNDDGIFMMGGATHQGRQNDVWKFNSATFKFELDFATALRPPVRASHSSSSVASNLFIAFGRQGSILLNDIWSFDFLSQKWSEIAATNVPRARQRAAAATIGPVIYFFGGETSQGLTNELLAFQTATSVWTVISQQLSPQPRTLHSLVSVYNQLVLFGGSQSLSDSSNSNDLHIFQFASQTWSPIVVTSNSTIPEPRRAHAMVVDSASQDMFLFGGMYQIEVTLMDRYRFYGLTQKADGSWEINIKKLTSSVQSGKTMRSFIRSHHMVAGAGNHFIICGGSITTSFPAPVSEQCYLYDAVSGSNTILPNLEVPLFEASAAYFRNALYLFGGQLSGDSIERPFYLNHLQIWEYNAPALCGAGIKASSACAQCSAGSQNPTCAVVAAGYYSSDASTSAVACSPGTYSNVAGAQGHEFCVACPVSTFTNTSGSTSCLPCSGECPIGSSTNTDADASAADKMDETLQVENPSGFTGGRYPSLAFIVFAGVTGGVIVIIILLLINSSIRESGNKGHYFSEENMQLLESIYAENEIAGFGLDAAGVYNCLTDPRLHCKTTPEFATATFKALDDDGSGFADMDEFLKIVIHVIDDEHMQPMPGSQRAEHGPRHAGIGFLARFRFSVIDMYLAQHQLAMPGDPLCVQKTKAGGVFSLIFAFSATLLIMFLIIQFLYVNNFETKGSLPTSVLPAIVRSDMIVTARVFGGLTASSCVAPSANASSSSSSSSSSGSAAALLLQCVVPATVVHKHFNPDSSTLRCSFDDSSGECVMEWKCYNCTVPETTGATVEFIFHPAASAQYVRVSASSSTGVHNEFSNKEERSQVELVLLPESNTTVFRGRPGTNVAVRAAPIHFSTVRGIEQKVTSDSGYQLQVWNVTRGHTVSSEDFNLFFGTPIAFTFTALDVAVLVDRQAKQSILQVITGILGAISGISAAILFVVQSLDSRDAVSRYEEYVKNLPKHEESEIEPSREDVDRDRRLLSGLLQKRVNFGVATEHLKLIRECVASEVAAGQHDIPPRKTANAFFSSAKHGNNESEGGEGKVETIDVTEIGEDGKR